jgi:phosphoglucomutase
MATSRSDKTAADTEKKAADPGMTASDSGKKAPGAKTDNGDTAGSRYAEWLGRARDPRIREELLRMGGAGSEAEIEEAFGGELAFGTAGLRGVMGAGTARMNVYTVARASGGLASYVLSAFPEGKRSVAVSYDSRFNSRLFAERASAVFAAAGLRVYIYPELMPTPCLSFAVRRLGCAAGVMVTASHNPAKYNGYKVYGPDGCQITSEAADAITEAIARTGYFDDVGIGCRVGCTDPSLIGGSVGIGGRDGGFERYLAEGRISYIDDGIYREFLETVMGQSMLGQDDPVDRDVAIVYSPLNGTGLRPVTDVLRMSGFTGIYTVPEQAGPDGSFRTCPFPNPEIREAMELGLRDAGERGADLLLATDPDCDRVGIAVRNGEGSLVLLTGNETGILLLDYICSMRTKHGTMPGRPVAVKTVVTSDMTEAVAAKYGVQTLNVLTGFKYIGNVIKRLEEEGRPESFILGFEESYGYLSGSYVRDKDGVGASFLICEMFAYYRAMGISLWERLEQLYAEFGYTLCTCTSYYYEGGSGMEKMRRIMSGLRGLSGRIGGREVTGVIDYLEGIDGLPKSDVIKFMLDGGCSATVRPSGTEPKIKLYLSVSAGGRAEAQAAEVRIREDLETWLKI